MSKVKEYGPQLSYTDRRLRNLFEDPKSKYVLVFTEKHSTRYFDASTLRAMLKSCLKVLTERRQNARWWYGEAESLEDFKAYMKEHGYYPSMTRDQVNALPPGSVRKAAEEEIRYYQERLAEREEHEEFLKLCDEAIAAKDGRLAYEALDMRNQHEYERMNIESVETGDDV